jgi:hypothetical protein
MLKNATFSRLHQNVTECKIRNAKILTSSLTELTHCLTKTHKFTISFLSQFPPNQATTLTASPHRLFRPCLTLSLTPDFVQSSLPCLTLSQSPFPFPFFLSPFPSKLRKHFHPDPEHSWRDKGKNPKLCFFMSNGMLWIYVYVLGILQFASGYFFRRERRGVVLLVISSVSRVQLCFSSVKLSNNGLLLCCCFGVADSAKQGSNEATKHSNFQDCNLQVFCKIEAYEFHPCISHFCLWCCNPVIL